MRSAFRVEFEEHLKTGSDYLGQRYREDMNLGKPVRDLTLPEIPEVPPEFYSVPDTPLHWTKRVPNRNPLFCNILAK